MPLEDGLPRRVNIGRQPDLGESGFEALEDGQSREKAGRIIGAGDQDVLMIGFFGHGALPCVAANQQDSQSKPLPQEKLLEGSPKIKKPPQRLARRSGFEALRREVFFKRLRLPSPPSGRGWFRRS